MGDADIIRYHGTTRRGTKSTNLIHADLPELDLDTYARGQIPQKIEFLVMLRYIIKF